MTPAHPIINTEYQKRTVGTRLLRTGKIPRNVRSEHVGLRHLLPVDSCADDCRIFSKSGKDEAETELEMENP
ncbi:hypothetical protein TorRG33x02_074670 [Trema orientale]|uniref:Uncharacterized protein n=1 Tax=Trema orientale TaxID=63057 RepID=A0A2P5FG44_TREOI|nr:hypothetical protein TorRG33x02_074670 [Trema orientale]